MAEEHDDLRSSLGRVGAWTFAFDSCPAARIAADARAIEALGYSALWVPEGGGSRDIIGLMSHLLWSTNEIAVASGIANITSRHPEVLQAGATLLADAFGKRLVLGVGVGHEYTTERRGIDWKRPLLRTSSYLDGMDRASDRWPAAAVPVRRLLAALGDRMLELSAERALGAHTYFVPPSHTQRARAVLGPDPVLAVEQTVVLDPNPVTARRTARNWAKHYLALPNYANNWRRMGFGEVDVAGEGSDLLIDAGIAWGSVETVAVRIEAHFEAGADHVCIQVISDGEQDTGIREFAELAEALNPS